MDVVLVPNLLPSTEERGLEMVSIIAILPIKAEKMDEFLAASKDLVAGVGKEEGNLLYTLNRTKKDPNIVVIMERYKDQAAVTAHSSTDYFKAFSAKVPGFLSAAPEITVMEEVASA
jgi:quinol monooxygenase YgiN